MSLRVVKTHLKGLILAVACIMSAMPVCADKIKVLPLDASVSTAVLPNGLSCYVVASPAQKGRADFALVQNTGRKTIADVDDNRLVDISREGLAAQRRLLHPSVQDFLLFMMLMPGRTVL